MHISCSSTLYFSFAQFEPESFVDGLLGIGIAGGGTSKTEGKALESRLAQMRKERNERAKTATAASKKEKSSGAGGGPAGEMTLQGLDSIAGDMEAMGDMELVTPGGNGNGGGGGSKKKNNKKKKKKKKVKR